MLGAVGETLELVFVFAMVFLCLGAIVLMQKLTDDLTERDLE